MLERPFLNSTSDARPLRIGLFLNGLSLGAWQRSVLQHIAASNFCEVAFLIVHEPREEAGERRGIIEKLLHYARSKRARSQILYWRYVSFDRKFYGHQYEPDPLAAVDCSDLLDGIPRLGVTPIVKAFTHRFDPVDVETIRGQKLDLILRWGFNIIRGDVLSSAKHGVWSYHHGDNDYYRGGPAGFWELVEGAPTTGVLLQVLNEELDAGLVLAKALLATSQGPSVTANRFRQYWAGAPLVIQKLYELHQYGADMLVRKAVGNDFRGRKKLYRAPRNRDVARFMTREILKKVNRILRPTKPVNQWRVAVRNSDRRIDPSSDRPDLAQFTWLESPPGTFWADPFVIEHEGTTWLLVEEYQYGEGRGVLSAAPLSAEGELGEVRQIMEADHHLSFPFVFEDEGSIYLIPESRDNNCVDLYRADDFPHGWTKVATLLDDFPALDTILWRQDGLYWFFLSDPHYRLLLFYSESLTGRWTHHPMSPLSYDVRNARNAGAFFRFGGRLIRPAQDCAIHYGRALSFQEITKLTRTEFDMKKLSSIEGAAFAESMSGLTGVHTYNRCGSVEVVDGVRAEKSNYLGP